jgi:hypothetical protein
MAALAGRPRGADSLRVQAAQVFTGDLAAGRVGCRTVPVLR